MAERKAVNKYYPPDWTPDKGSINKYVGQHPLRDRARKLSEGILVIRFEMPYNIWCDGCKNHVAMGVRFNAEKKKVGQYYSTPIWQFTMKCHLCTNKFVIQTDPKNTEYVVISGAQRKNEIWKPEDSETIALKTENEAELLATDALYKLEHEVDDQKKASMALPVLQRLQDMSEHHWKDDYAASQLLRRKFRNEKKDRQKAELIAKGIKDRNALAISIVNETDEDIQLAKRLRYRSVKDSAKDQSLRKRLSIEMSSVFNSAAGTNSNSTSALANKIDIAMNKRQLGIDHRSFRRPAP